MKKYSIDKLTMAQIPAKQISKRLLQELEDMASYKDTDKTLNESIISVDCLLTISTEWGGANESTESGRKFLALADEAFELYKRLEKYNYIQIAKI